MLQFESWLVLVAESAVIESTSLDVQSATQQSGTIRISKVVLLNMPISATINPSISFHWSEITMNAKSLLALGVLLWTLAPTQADEPSKSTPEKLLPSWDKNQAAKYLDSRQEAWFAWSRTDRGAGSSKTSCMSCHTVFAYAMARPALRGALGKQPANSTEKRVIDQTRLRVSSWKRLDEPAVGRLYAPMPRQSTGTEAILNAAILASDDFYSGRAQPSTETLQAFQNLWQEQLQEGAEKGAWPWMSGWNLGNLRSPYTSGPQSRPSL